MSTRSTPSWDRLAQLLVGVAVAFAALRRGRWPVVLLAVIAARLLLDPETYAYYSSGLVMAAAAADLLTRHRLLPLWTAACASWYALNVLLRPVVPAAALGLLRVGVCVALLACAALAPRPRREPAAVAPTRA